MQQMLDSWVVEKQDLTMTDLSTAADDLTSAVGTLTNAVRKKNKYLSVKMDEKSAFSA